MIARYDSFAAGLKVVGQTEPTPGLPYIAAKGADTEAIYQALVTAADRLSPRLIMPGPAP